jgi:hypothetical protein
MNCSTLCCGDSADEDNVRRKNCRNFTSRKIKIRSLNKLVALLKWVGDKILKFLTENEFGV